MGNQQINTFQTLQPLMDHTENSDAQVTQLLYFQYAQYVGYHKKIKIKSILVHNTHQRKLHPMP